MSKPRDERQKDLFRPALEQIIDVGHPLVRLAQEIDWRFLEQRTKDLERVVADTVRPKAIAHPTDAA